MDFSDVKALATLRKKKSIVPKVGEIPKAEKELRKWKEKRYLCVDYSHLNDEEEIARFSKILGKSVRKLRTTLM